jgi:rhodanese-related sulfurtransferase
MPTEIDRHSVQRLMMQDAQLVEVLPEKEFAEEHLPGALNIPLSTLVRQSVATLRQDRPVIVYCYDMQ